MQALHLKYRPQTLADLVGQPSIQACLTQAVARQQIAPAYLFCGPRGTGKTSTARILAKSLNCLSAEAPTTQPCGTCSTCKGVVSGSSLDVMEIDAASHGGVDDARELVRNSQLAPAQGRYRVIIIDEAHMLTPQAQNALLKLIEEPPSRVVFILATTEPHKVLPTISSRCLSFGFRPIAQKVIKQYITGIAEAEDIQVKDSGINAIARLCRGGLRDALQLIAKAALLDGDDGISAQDIYQMVGHVCPAEIKAVVKAIQARNVIGLLQDSRDLVEAGHSPEAIHLALLEVYHDLLLLKEAPGQGQLLTSLLTKAQLEPLATAADVEQIYQALEVLDSSERQLRFSPSPQPWLEATLLKLMPAPKRSRQSSGVGSQPIHDPAAEEMRQFFAQSELAQAGKAANQPASQSADQPTNQDSALTPDELDHAWNQMLRIAKPKARALLETYCRLSRVDLNQGEVTLIADRAKQSTLAKNKAKVQDIIEQALRHEIELTLTFVDPDPEGELSELAETAV